MNKLNILIVVGALCFLEMCLILLLGFPSAGVRPVEGLLQQQMQMLAFGSILLAAFDIFYSDLKGFALLKALFDRAMMAMLCLMSVWIMIMAMGHSVLWQSILLAIGMGILSVIAFLDILTSMKKIGNREEQNPLLQS